MREDLDYVQLFMDKIKAESTSNLVSLEECLKDAREAVYIYSICRHSFAQSLFVSELVEKALTTFLDESSDERLRKLFEETQESPKTWLSDHPGYYYPHMFEPARKWDEFLFSIHFILSLIYRGSFAADRQIKHLLEVSSLLEKSSSKYLGRVIRNCGDMSWVFGRLKMSDELNTSITIEKRMNRRIVSDWVRLYEGDEKPKIIELDDTTNFEERFGKRFNFQNFEQVKNAFRLRKVEHKKYLVWEEKAKIKVLKEKENLELIYIFLEKNYFCKSIPNFDNYYDSLNPKIVFPPRPNQDRFALLIPEQQWEYFEIFEKRRKANRFYDYSWVRANEILLALIKNYEQLDLKILKNEVLYFSSISTDTNDKFLLGIRLNYSLLLEFIIHLENLTAQERTFKLKFLSQRDSLTYDEIYRKYSVYDDDTEEEFEQSGEDWEDFLDNREKSEDLEIKFRIHLDSDYIQLAIIDINYLKKFKQGSTSKEELILSSEKDYKKYETFRETDAALDYHRAIRIRENISLERIVEVCEKYIVELIEVGKTFHPANIKILELDFAIPKLTMTLVKLKKWNEVIYWGDLYFNLPPNFRYAMNKSNEDSLRKRVLRAKKEIGKSEN